MAENHLKYSLPFVTPDIPTSIENTKQLINNLASHVDIVLPSHSIAHGGVPIHQVQEFLKNND